eukprot:m.190768 g.190768  ORF g.190768 m.190768 type:complete len:57 (-) comp15133_c0_seq2:308-478(-)
MHCLRQHLTLTLQVGTNNTVHTVGRVWGPGISRADRNAHASLKNGSSADNPSPRRI